MLRSTKALLGYRVEGKDGVLGEVEDFFFDGLRWCVRYLVVDTGTVIPGRKFLVPWGELGEPDWSAKSFPVGVTKAEVESSPTVDTKKPVSRQEEEAIHTHFQWVPYRTAYGLAGASQPVAVPIEGEAVPEPVESDEEKADLRSFDEVSGYHIEARDGEVGHVADLILNDDEWTLPMTVVDTRNWLPGKHVLLATEWVERIDWTEEKVHMALNRETIKSGPEYDPSEPVNKEMELRLYDYYGRPTSYVKREGR